MLSREPAKHKGRHCRGFFDGTQWIYITGERLEHEDIAANLATIGYHEKEQEGIFSKKNSYENWYCHFCSGCDGLSIIHPTHLKLRWGNGG